MPRKNPLLKYPSPARKWSFVRALDRGWTPQDTVKNPLCIKEMIDDCDLYQRAQLSLPGHEPASVGPTVSAPNVVPPPPPAPAYGFFETLASVGTLRSLHVVADGGGGWTATIKVTLKDGRRVYRYGRLLTPDGIVSMLLHSIEHDRWVPDKQ